MGTRAGYGNTKQNNAPRALYEESSKKFVVCQCLHISGKNVFWRKKRGF